MSEYKSMAEELLCGAPMLSLMAMAIDDVYFVEGENGYYTQLDFFSSISDYAHIIIELSNDDFSYENIIEVWQYSMEMVKKYSVPRKEFMA